MTSPLITSIIQAAIYLGGGLEVIIPKRDPTAWHQISTQNSYMWALEEGLLPIYRDDQMLRLFHRDNARIHQTPRATEWLFTHGVETFEWPVHSPDLNPIEAWWAIPQEKIDNLIRWGGQRDWRLGAGCTVGVHHIKASLILHPSSINREN